MRLTQFEMAILKGVLHQVFAGTITRTHIAQVIEGWGRWKHQYKAISIFVDNPDGFKEWAENSSNDSLYICVGRLKKPEKNKDA